MVAEGREFTADNLSAMHPPKFLFFDLGMVLLRFDVSRMCRQIADVAGIAPELVHQVLIERPLQKDYECGRVTSREFHNAFCRETGTCPAFESLLLAGSDIFDLNADMVPVIAHLHRAGYRLGILSNTCESHWEFCLRRFRMLGELFHVYALSYKIGAAKPESPIFRAAAALAKVAPEEVFFTDDLAANVAGARAAGFDAVQYTCTPQLVRDLWTRGVRFNY